jgi:predicted nucleic acid-binding Zn ribbon protein
VAKRTAPETCANCGAEIPPTARACPECGADERTGWAEQSIYDGLDLPEDEEERAQASRSRQQHETNRWFWWLIATVLILLFTLAVFGVRWH